MCISFHDPFFTAKPRDRGTGLGLSISHGIVKEHGGEIIMESEVGEWTKFHVDLPVVPAEVGDEISHSRLRQGYGRATGDTESTERE